MGADPSIVKRHSAKDSHFLWGEHIHDARTVKQLCISAQSAEGCAAAAVPELCQRLVRAIVGLKRVQERIDAVSGCEGYVRVALPVYSCHL